MHSQSKQTVRRPWQFSLGALLVAVVFMALASAAAKYFVVAADRSSADPMGQLLAFFSIPVFLCGGVGVLRGRLGQWLWYGVGIDVVTLGLILLAQLAR
jgi:hypothetical protein